jgi:hypothetical protein
LPGGRHRGLSWQVGSARSPKYLGVFHCEATGWVPVDALTFGVAPVNAWIDAAEAALSEGRAGDAVSAARRVVRAAPHDVAALVTLGAAEDATGAQDPTTAQDAWEELIDPAVGVRRVLARLPAWFQEHRFRLGVSLRTPCARPDGAMSECATPSPVEGAAAVAVPACDDDVPLRLRVAFEDQDELAGSVHVRARPAGAADTAWRTLAAGARLPRSQVVTVELPASRWSTPELEVSVDAVVGLAEQDPIRTRRWTLRRVCEGKGDVEPLVSPEASAPSTAPGSSPAPPVSPAPTPAANGEAPAPAAPAP